MASSAPVHGLPDPGDHRAHHADVDVGLEQGDADLAQHLLDIGVAQATLAAEALEDPFKAVGQSFEHATCDPTGWALTNLSGRPLRGSSLRVRFPGNLARISAACVAPVGKNAAEDRIAAENQKAATQRSWHYSSKSASTNSSGSKGMRSAMVSPTPTSFTGMPSSVWIGNTMPPLADPSSLVSTTPVTSVASAN